MESGLREGLVEAASMVLGRFEPRSTKIPPKTKTFAAVGMAAHLQQLAQAARIDDFLSAFQDALEKDAGVASAALYVIAGGPPRIVTPPRRAQALAGSPALSREIERLKASGDVANVVAAAPFWHGLSVTGSEWDPRSGSTANAITLAPTAIGSAWMSPVLSFSDAEYREAALSVIDKQNLGNIGDTLVRLRIIGAADYPQLYFAKALGMLDRADQVEYTCELLDLASSICLVAVHRLKHLVQAPRPKELVGGIQFPTRLDPTFTAFPGGHAALCSMQARLLALLSGADPATTATLDQVASGIAEDRELAGLHSAVDTRSGLAVGASLAPWLVDMANEHGALPSWSAVFVEATKEWV